MKQRGRRSGAGLALAASNGITIPGGDGLGVVRITTPCYLTTAQAEVWSLVIGTKPLDWFASDTEPLLYAYCCAVVEHRELTKMINAFSKGAMKHQESTWAVERYEKLSKMQERQVRLLTSLATKMRLTQQSQYDAAKAARRAAPGAENQPAGKTRPWEEEEENEN